MAASPDDITLLTGGSENPHAPPAIKADGSPAGTIRERCRRASVNNSVNVTTGLQARCHPLSVARHVGYARAWNSIGVFRKTCEVQAHGESVADASDVANDSMRRICCSVWWITLGNVVNRTAWVICCEAAPVKLASLFLWMAAGRAALRPDFLCVCDRVEVGFAQHDVSRQEQPSMGSALQTSSRGHATHAWRGSTEVIARSVIHAWRGSTFCGQSRRSRPRCRWE